MEEVRKSLGEIRECESVRRRGQEEMAWLVGLLSRHPLAEEKLAGMRDLQMGRSRLNKKAWEVTVVKENGSVVDMSWQQSIRGRCRDEKARLKKAMREAAFEERIRVFRNITDRRKCGLYGEGIVGGQCEVDHFPRTFAELVREFMASNEHSIPKEFVDNSDYQTFFREEDRGFEEAWKEHHRKEAGLQIVCVECNRRAHLA